jgi:hypothetical protein
MIAMVAIEDGERVVLVAAHGENGVVHPTTSHGLHLCRHATVQHHTNLQFPACVRGAPQRVEIDFSKSLFEECHSIPETLRLDACLLFATHGVLCCQQRDGSGLRGQHTQTYTHTPTYTQTDAHKQTQTRIRPASTHTHRHAQANTHTRARTASMFTSGKAEVRVVQNRRETLGIWERMNHTDLRAKGSYSFQWQTHRSVGAHRSVGSHRSVCLPLITIVVSKVRICAPTTQKARTQQAHNKHTTSTHAHTRAQNTHRTRTSVEQQAHNTHTTHTQHAHNTHTRTRASVAQTLTQHIVCSVLAHLFPGSGGC